MSGGGAGDGVPGAGAHGGGVGAGVSGEGADFSPEPVARAPGPGRRRGRWGRLVGILAVVAVAALLAHEAVGNFGALSKVHVRLRAGWLVAAVPCSVVSGLLLALAWRSMLAAWGANIGRAVAVRVWWRSQASRYLPTGAFAVASREVLAGRVGVARSLGATSNVVELGVLMAWGAVVAGALLPSSLLPVPARVLVALGGSAAVVALPWGMRLGSRLVPRLVPRLAARVPALADMGLAPLGMYRSFALYAASIAAKSAAFTLMVAGLVTVHPGDAALLMGAVQGASIVGVLSISPAGLGVREALLIVLLGPRFGAGNALALAIAWRAWELAFELAWLAVGGGAARWFARSGRRPLGRLAK